MRIRRDKPIKERVLAGRLAWYAGAATMSVALAALIAYAGP